MQASSEFLEKVLVNNRTVAEKEPFLRSSWIAAVMVLLILLLVAAPRLRLDAGSAQDARTMGVVIRHAARDPLHGDVWRRSCAASAGRRAAEQDGLQISLDEEFLEVRTGDELQFQTLLENNGQQDSPPSSWR